MNIDGVRTHDYIYLDEKMDQPKESFKFIVQYAENYLNSIEIPVVLDIGCAAGSFLDYFKKLYPNAIIDGLDIVPDLLEKARKKVQSAHFVQGDISGFISELGLKKYDAVFMSGVHSIFDDLEPVFDNIVSLLKSNGRAYVFGIFNPEPLDVIIRSRRSNTTDAWEKGWNLFSIDSVSHLLAAKNLKYHFKEFLISIDIKKHEDDPLRSWTVDLAGGKKIIQNGLQLVHPFYLLEIING